MIKTWLGIKIWTHAVDVHLHCHFVTWINKDIFDIRNNVLVLALGTAHDVRMKILSHLVVAMCILILSSLYSCRNLSYLSNSMFA